MVTGMLRTAPAFVAPPPGATGIDDLLAAARARLRRLSPLETFVAVGALSASTAAGSLCESA